MAVFGLYNIKGGVGKTTGAVNLAYSRPSPFFCMVDRRKRLHRDTCSAMCQGQYGFASTAIPAASVVERMGVEQAPLFSYGSRTRAAQAYRELWGEIQALVVG